MFGGYNNYTEAGDRGTPRGGSDSCSDGSSSSSSSSRRDTQLHSAEAVKNCSSRNDSGQSAAAESPVDFAYKPTAAMDPHSTSFTPGPVVYNSSKHSQFQGTGHLPGEVLNLKPAILTSYMATFVFGVAGNSLVIYIIAYYKTVRTKSVANYYIWNLSFADLFFILTLPFFCYTTYYQDWPFGWFVCKLSYAIRETNRFASVFTLVALSMDRYIASFYNLGHWRTIRVGKLVCIVVWLLCLAISTPYWIYAYPVISPIDNKTSCRFDWPEEDRTSYREMWTYFQLILALAVPTLLIFGSYALLTRRLKTLLRVRNASTQTSRIQKPSKKMTRMVLVVVFTFFFCQTPYHIVQFMSLRKIQKSEALVSEGKPPYLPSETEYKVFVILNGLAQILAFVSSCCNPIIYGLLNDNYRKLYTVVLCRCCRAVRRTSLPSNIELDPQSCRPTHAQKGHPLSSIRNKLRIAQPQQKSLESGGQTLEMEKKEPLL